MAPKKKKAAKKKAPAKKKAKKPATRPRKGETPRKGRRSKLIGRRLEQSKPFHLDDIEAAKLEELLGHTFDELTKFQGLLLRDKQIEPRITLKELGARYKVSTKAIANALYDDRFRSAELKINTDIFKRVLSLRVKAVENAGEYLHDDNTKSYRRFEMTRIFVQKLADSDNTLPEPDVDGPEFDITGEET